MYAATSRFANRCLRGGGFATIGSPLKFGLRKLHVRFTPKNGLRWSDRPCPKGARKRHAGHPATDETDPAWRAGALFTTSAKPEFSAYFWAGCEWGFDAFAVPVNKHIRHFPDTKRPNPTFSSAATQTPDSRLITLLCGWCRPLCHCHQDRPTGSSRDQKIGLEQLHLPTIPFPLESPYTVPDRS
jgi:hypothetical protein